SLFRPTIIATRTARQISLISTADHRAKKHFGREGSLLLGCHCSHSFSSSTDQWWLAQFHRHTKGLSLTRPPGAGTGTVPCSALNARPLPPRTRVEASRFRL